MYGYLTRRHFRKVEPWLLRLETATAGLAEDMQRGSRAETLRSLEDVWFWVGRTISEVLASQEELAGNPVLAERSQVAIGTAAAVATKARRLLEGPR